MEEETKKRIENVEDNLDKVMLENRDLDKRVEKLEGNPSHFVEDDVLAKNAIKSKSGGKKYG